MRIAFVTTFVVGCFLAVGLAQAQVPERLSYQGLLTTQAGQPITDGAYRVTFRLYAEDGTEALFEETQTVAVAEGLFSTMIGKETLLDLPFDQAYHLTVEVEGQPESEKVPLATSPYALNVADGAVVRSISGLKDDVEIVAGEGIQIEQRENRLVISAQVGLRGADGGQPLLLGPGGSNVGLDAAYDAGRVITADGGAAEVHGLATGNVAARVLNGDFLVEDNTGGKPNIRFKTSGGAIGVQEWRFNLNSIGYFTVRDQTGGANTFVMVPGVVSNLMRLQGGQVFVNQSSPTGQASLYALATAGNFHGVHGTATNTFGYGLVGQSTSTTGDLARGLYAENQSDDAAAVQGINLSAKGNRPYGELGGLRIKVDIGVNEPLTPWNDVQFGAYGHNRNGNTWDLHGYNAVSRHENLGGDLGIVNHVDGLYGSVECAEENDLQCHAVHGRVINFTGIGELAGLFEGHVTVTGTLAKGGGAFKIDHPLDPENKYLYHSFVESPDMMNVYNGNTLLDDRGEAWIELPDYFDALNSDYRYQLTAIGAPGPNLYVAEEISGNRFKVAGGQAGMKVSWQVTGVRQDAWAKANRIPNEEWKRGKAQGRYLHPRELGKPIEMGIYAEPSHAAEARAQGNDRND